ncbi:RluA family pseudouridine synthase [Serpentinicella sp. ANB-PHB4]|uniref:RluA family pseudouridine synthase n=1 Tax=Serpentinicella sp. ANB-PHB4 TaxID=3074076 RepID=UPI002859F9C9|nr:RluA family pseudouridine synthase [Serpentinicella sp. ANB-PHB4]MDR5657930.1 RluA family pseudouridine synthase [Serpentinicella sp. ANB-PHB4]
MESYVFEVEDREGLRLDVYLSEQLKQYSRNYIQQMIKDGLVTVNKKSEKRKYIIKIGDEVSVQVPVPKELDVKSQNIPLDIVFEDEDLLIINKPQGMVVHPGAGNYENTVVNAILYHCRGQLSSINGIIRPGIVHRIDKDTSGLLMVAKNNFTHRSLAQQLKEHSITRQYHAIAVGKIKDHKIKIDAPIGRNPNNRLKMAVVESGRNAITHVSVISPLKDHTYIEAQLETGRTHQIRVHMAYIKHPLLGDEVYGKESLKFNLEGQVLHAKTLGFIHPRNNKYIEFNSEIPNYFSKLLNILKT